MRLTQKKALVLAIVVVLIAVGFTAYNMYGPQRTVRLATQTQVRRTFPVQRMDLVKIISGTGSISPARDVDLTFGVSGKVKEVHVSSGEMVEAGQLLAVLDDVDQRLRYLSAKREYEVARIEGIPNVIEEAKLALEVAEANLAATKLTAPFAGMIADINLDEEEMVYADASSKNTVVRLIDTSQFYLEVNVDEVDIGWVEIGQRVNVVVDAYPNLPVTGTVVEIGLVPASSSDIVVFPVKIKLDSVDPRVKTGMTAKADIIVQEEKATLVVPIEAIVEMNGESFVSLVEGESTRLVPVTTGISNDSYIQIVEGLTEGDQVLASNFQAYQAASGQMQRGQVRVGVPGLGGGPRR